MKIKDLQLAPPLLLAPMAGLTHSALRTLLLRFGGVGLLSTEMLAASKLPVENKHLSPFLVRTEQEKPLSYQLLVRAADEVAPALEALHRLDADAVDINLGCPAPKVRRSGGGSSLMDAPELVREIIAQARRKTALPLTAKIRLGESFSEEKLQSFCQMLEGEGIDLLTVHARLRKEAFCRKPHWQWVAKVKEWVSIPVIANGSVLSVADAKKCLQVSNADGLMIGRGAAYTPWIFADIAREVYGIDIPKVEICLPAVYADFVVALLRFVQERRLGRMKEFTHYFAKNYFFGHTLACAVQGAGSVEQAWQRACAFFQRSDEQGVAEAEQRLAEVTALLMGRGIQQE
ncbi:tRNA-dihydrouridine synthase family protein [Desulfobulbus sp. N2]|nr:tRNA-dihydrouridine synthase family protein [Desulfobulbus sp. US4]MCW5204681.1 tRNA-dihydrouridine synthase family protein [Desulfobulbus sp. N2]